jgi:hypothetical protein
MHRHFLSYLPSPPAVTSGWMLFTPVSCYDRVVQRWILQSVTVRRDAWLLKSLIGLEQALFFNSSESVFGAAGRAARFQTGLCSGIWTDRHAGVFRVRQSDPFQTGQFLSWIRHREASEPNLPASSVAARSCSFPREGKRRGAWLHGTRRLCIAFFPRFPGGPFVLSCFRLGLARGAEPRARAAAGLPRLLACVEACSHPAVLPLPFQVR